MSRLPSAPPPTEEDFTVMVDAAVKSGTIYSDTGITQPVLDTLSAIVEAYPNVPQRLIDAAWAAFHYETGRQ